MNANERKSFRYDFNLFPFVSIHSGVQRITRGKEHLGLQIFLYTKPFAQRIIFVNRGTTVYGYIMRHQYLPLRS